MKKFLIALIVIFVFVKLYDILTLSRGEIWGTYINNNSDPILEGPNSIDSGFDTLWIYADNRFKNNCWGVGNYQLENNFLHAEIRFTYSNSSNWGGFSTTIVSPFYSDYKIWLNKDLNYYYKRISGGN